MSSKKIKIELITGLGIVGSELFPKKSYKEDACYDVRAAMETRVKANDTAAVPLGFRIELPKDWEAQIRPRSGKTLKNKYHVVLGTIDCGYTGQVHALVYNPHPVDILIEQKEKVAQMIVKKIDKVKLVEGVINKSGSRGLNGLGSTDKI